MQNPALPAKGLGRLVSRRSASARTADAASMAKRNRILFALASVATLAGSYFGVIKPENIELQQTRAQADQAEATVSQLRAELKHLQDLERRAPELAQQAGRLDEALPTETRLARFILQVQEASTAAKLDWVSANPSPPVASAAAPGLMESSVAMTGAGSYSAVQDFLARLENLNRAVKIGSVDITLAGGDATNPNAKLNVSINLKMFLVPTAQPLTGDPVAAPASPAAPAPAPPGTSAAAKGA